MGGNRKIEEEEKSFQRKTKKAKISIMSSDKKKINSKNDDKNDNEKYTKEKNDIKKNNDKIDDNKKNINDNDNINDNIDANDIDANNIDANNIDANNIGADNIDDINDDDINDDAEMVTDFFKIIDECEKDLENEKIKFINKKDIGWITARSVDISYRKKKNDNGIQVRDIKKKEDISKEDMKVKFDDIEVHDINVTSDNSKDSELYDESIEYYDSLDYDEDACTCNDIYSDETSDSDKSFDYENYSGSFLKFSDTSCSPVIREFVEDDIDSLLILDNIKYINTIQYLIRKNVKDFLVCSLDSYILSIFGIVDFELNSDFFDEKIRNVANNFKMNLKTRPKKNNKFSIFNEENTKPKTNSTCKDLKIVIYNRIVNSFNHEIFKISDYNGYFMFISEIFTGLKETKHIEEAFPEYGKKVTSEPPKFIENIHLNKNYILKKRATVRNSHYDIFLLDSDMMKQFLSAVYADCDE
ncbi:hypothetical protein DMUE_2543 [Dictyocoela muelleri]|nr:hypothetical protein DMUE_2543 [Dictyocoela muelleri]